MNTTVQKWGNSQGIRIPKHILEEVGLKINDEVKLKKVENKIIIEKVENNATFTLKEHLESYYGKPIEEIKNIDNDDKEINWGKSEGDEVEW
jgi:antitoxin MazE